MVELSNKQAIEYIEHKLNDMNHQQLVDFIVDLMVEIVELKEKLK